MGCVGMAPGGGMKSPAATDWAEVILASDSDNELKLAH
jgi:hypothetical protein